MVPFTQAGSGAIERTLYDRGMDFVDALDQMTAAQRADVRAGTLLVDVASALNTILAAHDHVYLPPGKYLLGSSLTFAGRRKMIRGAGFCTELKYTGTGTAIDFDGYAGCSVENLLLWSLTGATGIDIGPDSGGTRFPHWWRLDRVMVIGDTPNWVTTALGAAINGWTIAAIKVEKAFYGNASNCEASFSNRGFYGINQHNGNTYTNCHARECNYGADWGGAASSNGNTWIGGNIEASLGSVVAGVYLRETDRNNFVGTRLEFSIGTHIIIDPSSGAMAQENQFIGVMCAGTAPSYTLGDGAGASQILGTTILGGRVAGTITNNADCLGTRIEMSPTAASGVTLTDTGYGSVVHLDFGGGHWYERPTSSNTTTYDHDTLVGIGGTRESMNAGSKTLSFAGAADLFAFRSLSVSSVNLPIMAFGAYRTWVSPLDGKMYIKGSDPSSAGDGTVIGTQT